MCHNILQILTVRFSAIPGHINQFYFSVPWKAVGYASKSNILPIAVLGDPRTQQRFTLEQSGLRGDRPAWTGGLRFTGNMTVKQQLSRPTGSPITFHGKHDGETTAHIVGGESNEL